MNTPLLKDSALTQYFVSYSRRDLTIVSRLKDFLAQRAASVWFDNDRINVGDNWMAEIESGIAHADELLLVVSNSSLLSPVVLQEVQIAMAQGKEVRPILIERLNTLLPQALSGIQHIDLSDGLDFDKLAQALAPEPVSLGEINEGNVTLAVKRNACCNFWPTFDDNMAAARVHPNLLLISATIETLLDRYPASSIVWLNSGILSCLLGDWETGLKRMRAHSIASGSFASWYMYALHLSRGGPVRLLDTVGGNEAVNALKKAESFGSNCLCMLLRTIYEFEFLNRSFSQLAPMLRKCVDVHRMSPDAPAEYLRFYWCMRASFGAFREYRDNIVDLIRTHGGNV